MAWSMISVAEDCRGEEVQELAMGNSCVTGSCKGFFSASYLATCDNNSFDAVTLMQALFFLLAVRVYLSTFQLVT